MFYAFACFYVVLVMFETLLFVFLKNWVTVVSEIYTVSQ